METAKVEANCIIGGLLSGLLVAVGPAEAAKSFRAGDTGTGWAHVAVVVFGALGIAWAIIAWIRVQRRGGR